MWDTAEGIRTLAGAEAQLVRETIRELVDAIRATKEVDQSVSLGTALFDNLSWQQQLAMLLKVAKPLLEPLTPPPPKTALMEASVAAIYAQMRVGVEYEIEVQQTWTEATDNDTVRRQQIVRALNERRPEESWPDAQCVLMHEWDLVLAEISGWVLADEDWNWGDITLDISPDKADGLKAVMGITEDYFLDIPPDSDQRPACKVWADLIELLSGQRPDEAVFDK